MSEQTIELGTWVKVSGLIPGAETILRFVPQSEVNYFQHRLPTDSLLGEALMGAEVGDRVQLDALGNDRMELTVLAAGRD